MDQSTKQFIEKHLQADIHQISLQAKRYPDVDIPLAIRQIAGRQKIKMKVPSFYTNTEILYPKTLSIEQSSSEQTAQYKANLIDGQTFIDLTGGFGIDFYYLSKKFKHGIYVERDEELCEIANHNFKLLDIPYFEVHHAHAEDFIQQTSSADWIYIDPHRRNKAGKKTVLIADCEPNLIILKEELFKHSSKLMIKLSPMLDIHQAVNDLPETKEVHIIAVDNECKEVLLILNNSDEAKNLPIQIKTININSKGENQVFEYQLDKEKEVIIDFTDETDRYLYEPNAAIMKAGAFKTIASQFNLLKFHPNTHLYTHNQYFQDFPGRIFQIEEVYGNSKQELQIIQKKYPKANISTRNYPLSAEALHKKAKISTGGETYIFALKTLSEKYKILICKKL